MTTPKPGDRIRLLAMLDDFDPIPPGSTGTVTFVYPHGFGRDAWLEAGVDWDNGRTLMLTVPLDGYEI